MWLNLKPKTQTEKTFCESGGGQSWGLKGEEETLAHQPAFLWPSKDFRF